jgi:hypothetical protein
MKFTKTTIAALEMPEGKTDHIEWDSDMPGFGIRLRDKYRSMDHSVSDRFTATARKPWRYPQD